jgi:hypothetical protein
VPCTMLLSCAMHVCNPPGHAHNVTKQAEPCAMRNRYQLSYLRKHAC